MDFKKWNNEARLFMIDKSEFYSDPKVYQFGFYDRYHRALKDSKANEMLEMLQYLNRRGGLGLDIHNKIEQLIKQVTEL